MKRFIGSDRNQIMMFSRSLADNLGEKHEIHAFAALLDAIPMASFLSKYSSKGGRAYHPSVMLGCLLYGFHRGWRSSRELQKACEENDAMRYLVGGQKIKFRAIADFRLRFGKEIGAVFDYSVSLLSRKRQNIGKDLKLDGTKIKANAADDQSYKKSDLEKDRELLRKEIIEYLSSGVELDIEEDKLYGRENSGYEISPEESEAIIAEFVRLQAEAQKLKSNSDSNEGKQENSLSQSEALKEPQAAEDKSFSGREAATSCNEENVKVGENEKSHGDTGITANTGVSILKKAKKYLRITASLSQNTGLSSEAKINLTDPDARFMKRNGKISQSYNVQMSSSEGYILSADIAENNSENDLKQLAPAVSKAEGNIEEDIETVSADAGYFHSSGLEYLEQKKIEGFIPSPEQESKKRKKKEDTAYEPYYFNYNEDEDAWLCPQKKSLEFHSESLKGKRKYSHYHARPENCIVCPVRKQCCTSQEDLRLGYRKLSLDEGFALKHDMIRKMKSEEAKLFYKKRGAEIEPIFGILKQARKFREFLLRGTQKAQIEVKIAATAFNLGKMVREQLA